MSANCWQLGEVANFEALTFNLALNPPFCQTAVGGSFFYKIVKLIRLPNPNSNNLKSVESWMSLFPFSILEI